MRQLGQGRPVWANCGEEGGEGKGGWRHLAALVGAIAAVTDDLVTFLFLDRARFGLRDLLRCIWRLLRGWRKRDGERGRSAQVVCVAFMSAPVCRRANSGYDSARR